MKNVANDGFARGKDPVNIVLALLKELAVPVTDATVREALRSHPYYPSLFCIADSLSRWGLETMALDVPYSGLKQLPCPFLAHCPIVGADPYLIVKEVTEGEIRCVDGRRKPVAIRKDRFYGIWDGKVLVMEKRDGSGEAEYSGRLRGKNRDRIGLSLLLAILCLPLLIRAGRSLVLQPVPERFYYLVLLAGSLAGIVITLMLLRYDYGLGGDRLQRWCSLNGRMSCEAVLRSGMARLGGKVSWSEIGLVYFAGSLLYGWWGLDHVVFPAPMIFIQLLALGYVGFSLVYQGLVVRKWCLLCLVVQAVLSGEGVTAIGMGPVRKPDGLGGLLSRGGTFTDYGILIYAYLAAVLGVIVLRACLLGQRERVMARQGLNRLKRNELVFDTLLRQEDEVRWEPPSVGRFMGAAEAEHSLLLVTNPDCPPCARAHLQLEELLRVNKRWKAQVIFLVPAGQEPFASRPAEHFADAGEAASGLAIMRDWCEKADIRYTPAIFVDGRRLPEQYDIEDLQFL